MGIDPNTTTELVRVGWPDGADPESHSDLNAFGARRDSSGMGIDPTATDPDAIFSPSALAKHLKRAAGAGRSPIGVRRIRVAIRSGELQASKIGNRSQVRWASFLRWLDGPCRVHPDPTTDQRIDAEIADQLRREGFPRLRGVTQ